jgi:hypothetical protein
LAGTAQEVIKNHAAFTWSIADLLRGDYKQSEYGESSCPWGWGSEFIPVPAARTEVRSQEPGSGTDCRALLGTSCSPVFGPYTPLHGG